jgi:hypothetical protein
VIADYGIHRPYGFENVADSLEMSCLASVDQIPGVQAKTRIFFLHLRGDPFQPFPALRSEVMRIVDNDESERGRAFGAAQCTRP